MEFKELTDEQWEFIRPLLPPSAREGRPKADDRRTVDAILYVLTTGCRWMDLPKMYGDDVTAWRRLRDWEDRGVWKGMMEKVIGLGFTSKKLKLQKISVDSSDVAAKKGGSSSATMVTRRSRGARYMPQSHQTPSL